MKNNIKTLAKLTIFTMRLPEPIKEEWEKWDEQTHGVYLHTANTFNDLVQFGIDHGFKPSLTERRFK